MAARASTWRSGVMRDTTSRMSPCSTPALRLQDLGAGDFECVRHNVSYYAKSYNVSSIIQLEKGLGYTLYPKAGLSVIVCLQHMFSARVRCKAASCQNAALQTQTLLYGSDIVSKAAICPVSDSRAQSTWWKLGKNLDTLHESPR